MSFPISAALFLLLQTDSASPADSSGGVPAAASAANAPEPSVEAKPSVEWTPTWSVGVSEAGEHPLTRSVIEDRLGRWLKKLPGAELDGAADLTRADFRREARKSLRRYALFIDRTAADVLSIQVLDEQDLAGLASLDLQCPGCDAKGWEVRLNEGMSALIEALGPLLKAGEPKPDEPAVVAEPEVAKGDASLSFQFRELGSGLKLIGVSVTLSQGEQTLCETNSEAKGKARCVDLVAGDYEWAASFTGYKPATGKLTLAAGEAIFRPVDLEPTRVNRFLSLIHI